MAAEWKRFQGPGQQWATHGGYYLGAGFQSRSVPGVGANPAPNLQHASFARNTPQGGLSRLMKPLTSAIRNAAEDYGRKQGLLPEAPLTRDTSAATSGDITALRRHIDRLQTGGTSPSSTGGVATATAPRVRSTGTPPADNGQMSFDLGDAPGVAPVKRSRRQAFGQFAFNLGQGLMGQ